MKRVALFLGLLLVFTLWHFPHRRLIEATLTPPAAEAGLALSIQNVRYAFPLSYKLDGVRLDGRNYDFALEHVRIAIGRSGYGVEAEACGGEIHGSVHEDKLDLSFADINPAACLAQGGLVVAGKFSGTLVLRRPGRGAGNGEIGRIAESGRIELRGRGGTLSGTLGISTQTGTGDADLGDDSGDTSIGASLGTWEFQDVVIDARLEGSEIVFTKGTAASQGVEWQLTKGRIFSAPTGQTKINAEVRARNADGGNRAKAVIGLLPRSAVGRDGWHRYKASGDIRAPTFVGLK